MPQLDRYLISPEISWFVVLFFIGFWVIYRSVSYVLYSIYFHNLKVLHLSALITFLLLDIKKVFNINVSIFNLIAFNYFKLITLFSVFSELMLKFFFFFYRVSSVIFPLLKHFLGDTYLKYNRDLFSRSDYFLEKNRWIYAINNRFFKRVDYLLLVSIKHG